MSRRANDPELELNLNLSPTRENSPHESGTSVSTSSSEISIEGSCVSSEPEETTMDCPSSLEAISMVLVGCPRCLMYGMLSGVDPKCPKCKSTVLLDFLKEESTEKTRIN